jgi:cytochrome bd-type quinol oxidase subunit 2
MIQLLSILAILLAIALPVLDYAFFRPRRRALGRDDAVVRGVERAIYLVFLVALAGMVVSSIFMLAIGDRMHRWMLILHMTLAPLFALCVTGLALLWTNDSRGPREPGERVAFWIVILSSFLTILSAMLGMMTWFGSGGQEILLNVHRVSSLVLFVAAAYQAWRLLTKQQPSAA